ncbi:MAG: protein-L-isoaspartate O-methyltransferase [Chromatiales bacterium]
MEQSELEKARFNMIHQQIQTWEVLDRRVLDLLTQVPRERFVPEAYIGLAFADTQVPIGHGERMMEPKLEARMLQALDVKPDDRVLEIGTGSGYVTACLARLGARVTSLEIHQDLSDAAEGRLEAQGIANAELVVADAMAGIPADGLFDVIAVTGSMPMRDKRFHRYLSNGGRLFMVVGETPVMEALLVTRTGDNAWHEESLFETELPPLVNAPRPDRFDF